MSSLGTDFSNIDLEIGFKHRYVLNKFGLKGGYTKKKFENLHNPGKKSDFYQSIYPSL